MLTSVQKRRSMLSLKKLVMRVMRSLEKFKKSLDHLAEKRDVDIGGESWVHAVHDEALLEPQEVKRQVDHHHHHHHHQPRTLGKHCLLEPREVERQVDGAADGDRAEEVVQDVGLQGFSLT